MEEEKEEREEQGGRGEGGARGKEAKRKEQLWRKRQDVKTEKEKKVKGNNGGNKDNRSLLGKRNGYGPTDRPTDGHTLILRFATKNKTKGEQRTRKVS